MGTRALAAGQAALGSVARGLAARPVATCGVSGFAVFFALVSANALFAQSGRHPHPLLTTRPAGGAQTVVTNDPATAGALPVPLVVEVQTALARAGYSASPIDGRPGKITSAAIRAFQSENALPVDGEASPQLLAALRRAERPADEEAPAGRKVASLGAEDARTANDAGPDGADGPSAAPVPDREMIRRVQAGLTSAKIADLAADGIMGSRTEAAVRAFQASQGLDVTGRPGEAVLSRLKSLSAASR